MDLFVIRGIVEELKREAGDAFLTKIYQLNRTDLVFRFRRGGKESQLLISTHPQFFRAHLTEKRHPNPAVPPRFCTYLRKHIQGARISGISQVPFERVIRFVLEKKMDAGYIRNVVLVAELVGKGSNVLLLEGEKILDCLHFRKPEDEHARPALPGLPYLPPPASARLSPGDIGPDILAEIAAFPPGERWKKLTETTAGIPPLLAREIEFLSEGDAAEFSRALRDFLDRYERAAFAPRIYTLPGGKKALSPFPLKSLEPGAGEAFVSMNAAADAYYDETVLRRLTAERKQTVIRRLKQLISRLERRQENLEGDREKLEKDLTLKDFGDLLVANYPRLKKGMREVEALDYRRTPPEPVLIPLDERLDAAGNVERCFTRYKKAKKGLEVISSRTAETERETAYLESVLFEVEQAEDPEALEEIREELQAEKILGVPRKPTGREEREKALPVRRFRSSEGLDIYCGKNNLGNDYLLRRLARGNDLWFHAQGVPGSHVLLRVGPKEPKFNSILEAATIAGFYSRGRSAGSMPVDYTKAKNIHKPRGARPGFVTYSQQKTLFVKPEKEKIEKMIK
jgi:predicted ribosome quality control (RQC) complex YloA/Tae2 family protein